jgi:bifunctional DNA-binding transcriptional regulator/antitoxin component of YhaV-PrlF toxin-antitoxin module
MVTLKIEQHADTKDLYIEIPHYIRQELNWQEGDTLVWEIQSDNSISVRKERSVSQYKKDIIQEYIQETFGQVYYSPEAQGSWG